MIRHSRGGVVVATLGWAAVMVATLRSAPESGLPHSVWCIVCGPLGGADVIQNILLFLPLGIGLGMMRPSPRFSLAVIIATTIGVETLQATVLSGRFASLGDILANTTGGALGVWLGRRHAWWLTPAPAAQRRLVLVSLAAALLLLVLATVAIRPVAPPSPLILQIAPVEPHGQRFTGSVLSVTLGDSPVAAGRLQPADDRVLRHGRTTMSFEIVSGPKTEFESSIVAIVDRNDRAVVRVSQDGADAVLGVHVTGSAIGLRSPRIVLRKALPEKPGDTVRINVDLTQRLVGLTATNRTRQMHQRLPLGASTSWIPLYPFSYHAAGITPISLGWLAALLFPAGYWTGSENVVARGASSSVLSPRRSVALLLAVASFVALGLGVFPKLLGFPAAPAIHWLAPIAGYAIGLVTGRFARRHSPS